MRANGSNGSPTRSGGRLRATTGCEVLFLAAPFFARPSSRALLRAPFFARPSSRALLRAPFFARPSSRALFRAPFFRRPSSRAFLRAPFFARPSSSLPDAEPPEHFVQHVLRVDTANEVPERAGRCLQMHGDRKTTR